MTHDYGRYTDDDLVALLNERDHAAFTEVYERYWSVLYLHARHLLHNDTLAKDAVHDVFSVLWNRAGTLALTTSLNAYLYRSVKNVILNDIRHEKVAGNYLEDLKRFYREEDTSTEEIVHLRQLQNLIEEEIKKLPPEMRKVFEMSRKLHLSNQTIAIELHKSEQTVKNQIKRAMQILREKLNLPSAIIILLLKL